MITWIAKVSFTKPLEHIKLYFKVIKDTKTKFRKLIHYVRSYCILVHLRILLPSNASKSSTCFEVKNFSSNNNQSVARKSNTY